MAANQLSRRAALLLGALAIAIGLGLLAAVPTAYADPSPAPAPTTSHASPTPSSSPSSTGTHSPVPTPAPTTSTNDDPAWYDISGQVRKAITDMLISVATSAVNPVMRTLGSTVLATPKLTDNPRVKTAWTTFLVIANAGFVLLAIASGYVLMSRETLQSRYGLKQLLPRLVAGGVAANCSLIICAKAITLANALTAAIVGQGVNGPTASRALREALSGVTEGTQTNGFLLGLLVLAALVMAIVVVIIFFLRLAMLAILIAVAPVALACHALPQAEGLAVTWWRAFAAVLGIQIGQAVVLLVTVRVFLTPNGPVVGGIPMTASSLVSVCMAIAMLWLMIKIPGWLKAFVLGPRRGRGLIGQVVSAVVAIKTLGVAAGMAAGSRRRPARPSPSTPPPARPTSAPLPRQARPARRPSPPAFSDGGTDAPMARPAGPPAPVAWSNPPQPARPVPPARRPPAPARFSAANTPAVPIRRPTTNPASATFTEQAADPPGPVRPAGTASPPTFSAAPVPQTPIRRSQAPVRPTFSNPTAKPAPPPAKRRTNEGDQRA